MFTVSTSSMALPVAYGQVDTGVPEPVPEPEVPAHLAKPDVFTPKDDSVDAATNQFGGRAKPPVVKDTAFSPSTGPVVDVEEEWRPKQRLKRKPSKVQMEIYDEIQRNSVEDDVEKLSMEDAQKNDSRGQAAETQWKKETDELQQSGLGRIDAIKDSLPQKIGGGGKGSYTRAKSTAELELERVQQEKQAEIDAKVARDLAQFTPAPAREPEPEPVEAPEDTSLSARAAIFEAVAQKEAEAARGESPVKDVTVPTPADAAPAPAALAADEDMISAESTPAQAPRKAHQNGGRFGRRLSKNAATRQ